MGRIRVLDRSGISPSARAAFHTHSRHERRDRAAQFRFSQDQVRCLGAGLLLDLALAQDFGVSSRAAFATGRHGKPFLRDHPQFHFNLSHAGDLVVCATSRRPVGVDVETVDGRAVHLARSHFTADEVDFVFGRGPEAEAVRFTTVWALKESYLKYRSCGLSVRLNTFCIRSRRGVTGLTPSGEAPLLRSATTPDGGSVIAHCGHEEIDLLPPFLRPRDLIAWAEENLG